MPMDDSMLLETDNTSLYFTAPSTTPEPGQLLGSVSTATTLQLADFTSLDVLLIFMNALLVLMIVIGCCCLCRFIKLEPKHVPDSVDKSSDIFSPNDAQTEQITIL
ncbi:hypothetical protein DdX_16819 [Ditylenchus destructor]|uniref:Uncharacterized protein n=1 Tax=Ditylenchus destructor TaxID=166010 RepID=A0AAD4MNB5_9BILA|nr:hypothetical protein DdX_16819 [Ditylenchus destructor]